MATTSSQRTLTAAPGQILVRRHTHLRDGVVMLAAGGGCAGMASIASAPLLDVPAALLGGGGVAVAALGHRRQQRHDLEDKLAQALAPALLGVRAPDWRTVRCGRWSNGWPGVPARIDLRHAPDIETNPEWTSEMLLLIEQRLGGTYTIASRDPRKCRIRLALKKFDPAEIPAEIPAPQQRATTALEKLLPTSVIDAAEFADDGRLVAIEAHHAIPEKIANSGYRRRIEATLTNMHPGRWRGKWDLTTDTVRFEERPSMPDMVWLPVANLDTDHSALLGDYRNVAIPYGVDEDGAVLVWYPGRLPHWLITGVTGTGKSSTIQAVIAAFTRFGWPVWIGDGKGGMDYMGFYDWPNVQVVAGTVEEQVSLIHRALELVHHRRQMVRSRQATADDFEPLLLILDEFTMFRAMLLSWYNTVRVTGKGGDPTKPPTIEDVNSILRLARALRVHVVLGAQRPDAQFFDGGEGRDNLPMRTSMGRLSPQGSMMMWENAAAGTTLPRSKTGRATTVNTFGEPIEVQTYRFPDPDSTNADTRVMLDQLRPTETRHPRMLIVPPEPQQNLDDDKSDGAPLPLTFSDWQNAQWALATDRPDLDPLKQSGQLPDGLDATTVSSPTYLLLGHGNQAAPPRPTITLDKTAIEDQVLEPDIDDPFAGYGEPLDCRPNAAHVGDLLELDGLWVVIDEEPEEDFDDPSAIAVSWRSDTDDAGTLSLPDDQPITIRRPSEED